MSEQLIQRTVLGIFTSFFLISILTYYNTSRVYRHTLPDITHITQKHTNSILQYNVALYSDTEQNAVIQTQQLQNAFKQYTTSSTEVSYQYNIVTHILNANNKHTNNYNTLIQQFADNHSANLYNTYDFNVSDIIQSDTTVYNVPTVHLVSKSQTTQPYTVHSNRMLTFDGTAKNCMDNIAQIVHNNIYNVLASRWNTVSDLMKTNHNRLSFTLLNSIDTQYTWQFNTIQHTYLQQFINKLKPIVDISVDSQILYTDSIIPDSVQPITLHNTTNNVTINLIGLEQLSNFVGSTEWNIQSQFVQQSIEIILYVPSTYMYVYDDRDAEVQRIVQSQNIHAMKTYLHTTFIVPDYGAVVILNDVIANQQLTDEIVHDAMQVVVAQLRHALNIHVPQSTQTALYEQSSVGITEYEYDSLLIQSYIQHKHATVNKLQSLYTLIDDVSEIPVSNDIAYNIEQIIHYYTHAHNAAVYSDWYTASILMGEAHTLADAVYYDPTMLPNLYFPQQHLYAVYAPLYLPISIPVLSAWFARCKQKRKQE